MKKLTLILICLFFVIPCQARIIYVDVNTSDNNDGSSWAKAYKFLQDALSDADSSGDVSEIWVAQGIYRPDETSVDPNGTGDREATFQLVNDVALRGGYAGFGEVDPNAWDVGLYETVLSGDLDANDVGDPTWSDPSREDNSYHIVTVSATNFNTLIDGFIIEGGNANSSSNWPHNKIGGGLYMTGDQLTIAHCKFMKNKCDNPIGSGSDDGGAAVYLGFNMSAILKVSECFFTKNFAGDNASGLMIRGGGSSRADLNDCVFTESNKAAIYNDASNVTLTNCVIYKHSVGLKTFNRGTSVLVNCTISRNTYVGIYDTSRTYSQHSLELMNCIVWDNGFTLWGEISLAGGVLTTAYSDIKGGESEVTVGNGVLNWMEGNIDTNPLFSDPNNGDYHLKSQAGRWDSDTESWIQDANTSLCIDAGNPGSSLGDEPNDANNIRINMGAYGGTAEASMPPYDWALLSDITNDGIVNFVDFAHQAGMYTDEDNELPGDLDRNGVVNFSDIALLVEDWLKITTWY